MAKGGVLLDIGVHLLDLLIAWWGQPVEVAYADDSMGGIEANCRLHLTFAQGHAGEVRLSRDCALPNRYRIQGTRGWVGWQVNEVNKLQIGFTDTDYSINGQLYQAGADPQRPTLEQPGFTFAQSFVRQLLNVAAAVQGKEALVVTGTEGLQSLRLIERCYQQRTLMDMPWLSPNEYAQARQLNHAVFLDAKAPC